MKSKSADKIKMPSIDGFSMESSGSIMILPMMPVR